MSVYVNTFLATCVASFNDRIVLIASDRLNSRAGLRARTIGSGRSNERDPPFLLSLSTSEGRQYSATNVSRTAFSIAVRADERRAVQPRTTRSAAPFDSDAVSSVRLYS